MNKKGYEDRRQRSADEAMTKPARHRPHQRRLDFTGPINRRPPKDISSEWTNIVNGAVMLMTTLK